APPCFSAPKSTSRRIENDNKRKRKWLLLRGACSERPVKKIIPDSSARSRERRCEQAKKKPGLRRVFLRRNLD
ncbi:MAG: hypothetical protein ACXW2U_18720, partial [Telluria sp.]